MSDIDGTVVAIQGFGISTTSPNNQNVLTWDAAAQEWKPSPPTGLAPWVGSVDTQEQVLARVPFTCRVTGTTPVSTGVTYTLPTDTSLSANLHFAARVVSATNKNSVYVGSYTACASNDNGSVSTSAVQFNTSASVGTWPAGIPKCAVSISGTTVTVEMYLDSGSATVDIQGFVDLIGV